MIHNKKSHNLVIWMAFAFIFTIIASAYFLPYIFSLEPYSTSEYLLSPPSFILDSKHYFLGTDDLGRDILARLVFGARNTLGIGLLVVLLSLFTGSILGLLASIYGGLLDFFVCYVNTVIMSFPTILFAILLLIILGPGTITSIIGVSIITIPGFTRVAQSVALEELKKDYIMAARSFGFSRFQIFRSELLPNCLIPILVQATFAFSDVILTISILGFLHIGVNPPVAEWGSMLADSYQFIQSAPYLVIFPGICIFSTVLAANLLGDQLLDKLRKS